MALGLTALYLLFTIKPLLEPSQFYFYHWSGSPGSLFLPVIANFIAFWLLLTILLLFARKPGRTRVAILTGLVLFLSCVYTHLNVFYHRFSFLNLEAAAFVVALLITVIVTMRWRPDLNARYESVFSKVTTILTFVGIFGIFILFNLVNYGWRAHSIVRQASLHQPQNPAPAPSHRIIWIIFDELSQDQVYAHRFPGLQLPAFDSLAASSTEFTDVVPSDINTEVVIPGMMMGRSFNDMKTSSSGTPSFHNPETRAWQRFDQYSTVFQDALHSGYSTGVVGWAFPYCRILSHVLDRCSWTNTYRRSSDTVFGDGDVLSKTLLLAKSLVYAPVAMLPAKLQVRLAPLFHFAAQPTNPELHLRDYLDIASDSDHALRDRSQTFLFLHLPIPHPDNIYDRKTGNFATDSTSSYLDNLALADKYLAHIQATLEQMGQWNSSTIVVMGDHGWRTQQIWRRGRQWRPEDELASHGGQFDIRPAYLVKLPGQTTSAHVDSLFHAPETRALFDQLMTDQITTPSQLAAWAQSAH